MRPVREPEQARWSPRELPIVPAGLVVLAIGVIVAILGPAELVAAQEHRRAYG